LTAEYRLCAEGRNQSPVNLTGLFQAGLPPLRFDYGAGGTQLRNNGHTVQVDYAPGHRLRVGNRAYELRQFHFHAPAEHLIDGRQYPMEVHLVHTDAQGHLAVVSVMFVAGAPSPLLSRLWDPLSASGHGLIALTDPVDARALLPAGRDHYHYGGSLTSPPCAEGVAWFVMKDVLSASAEQIARFQRLMGYANNRPVQPAFARPLLRSR